MPEPSRFVIQRSLCGSPSTGRHENPIHWAWAPDGSDIAFAYGNQIWLVKPDGTGPGQLTFGSGLMAGCFGLD